MKKGRLYTLVVFVIVILAAAVYTVDFLYQKEQVSEQFYKTEKAVIDNVVIKTVASGSVQPRFEILIKPQISGIIREIHVEPGDEVKKGDVLAEVEIVPNMASLSSAENRLSRAKISLEDAQKTYDRNAELYSKGVVSEMDMQGVELSLNQAKEEVLGAEDNLRIVKEGVASRGGAVSNTIIRSTIDGMVLDVPVEKGNSVIEANNFNDGTTIASVADMRDLVFEGKIDESEVEKLSVGMGISLSIGAVDNVSYPAVLEHISPKGVEESGAIQFEIKAAVSLEEDQFLRAGYSANAEVELDRRDSVLVIGENLVQYERRQAFVEVMTAPDVYERRDLKLGLSDGLKVEVLEGVTADDEIKVWNQPSSQRRGPKGRKKK